MGIFLLLFMLAGGVAGLVVAVPLLIGAVFLARRLARSRNHVWPVTIVLGTLITVLIVVVMNAGALPLQEVRPGSDYDKAALNLFIQAIAYIASAGVGYLLGAVAGVLCPQRETPVA